MENTKEKITVESVIKADIKTVWAFWTRPPTPHARS